MTTITWAAATSGEWFDSANWSPAQVPGSTDDALINLPGSYVVSVGSSNGQTVGSLTLDDATGEISESNLLSISNGLVINAGTFLIGGGTVDNSFLIDVGTVIANGLSNAGTIIDNGTLAIDGNYDAASLSRIGGTGTLQLGGSLSLASGTLDLTSLNGLAAIGLATTIQGETIVGSGTLGNSTLDAVTLQGAMSVLQAGTVIVRNGLVLTGTGGVGPGTLDLLGTLEFSG